MIARIEFVTFIVTGYDAAGTLDEGFGAIGAFADRRLRTSAVNGEPVPTLKIEVGPNGSDIRVIMRVS